jgi:hypothetical protein
MLVPAMVVDSLTSAGSALRRHATAVALGWAVTLALAVMLLLAFAERPTIDADAELIANNSFESGLAPWEETGDAVVERSIEDALVGNASARVEATGDRYGLKFLAAVIHPRAGERYAASAWVRGVGSAVGNRVTIRIGERGGETEPRTVAISTSTVRRSWTLIGARGRIADAGRNRLNFYLYVERSRRVGETFFVDQLSLVRTGTPTDAAEAE